LRGGVFINYRGDDSHSYGVLLYRELSRELPRDRIFLDSESIPAGADFTVELLDRVRRSRVLLAVIGPHWLTVRRAGGPTGGQRPIDDPNDWIRRELAEAFAAGVTVIPVLTDNATLPSEADLPADIAGLGRRQYRMLRHRDADADLARIRQDIAEAAPDLMPSVDAYAEQSDPVGRSRQRMVVWATAVLFAVLGLLAVLLSLRPGDHTENPSAAAGKAAGNDLRLWHTGARCPADSVICFYKQRDYRELLGWFTPESCDDTYSMLWPYLAASIQNRSSCRVILLSCPGDCWREWLGPGSENGTVDPPDAVDRIRLTVNSGPPPSPPPPPGPPGPHGPGDDRGRRPPFGGDCRNPPPSGSTGTPPPSGSTGTPVPSGSTVAGLRRGPATAQSPVRPWSAPRSG
jgi:hypothetical protein